MGSIGRDAKGSRKEAETRIVYRGARGLGWVDVHLLGATMIAGADLWTLDGALLEAAQRIGLKLWR